MVALSLQTLLLMGAAYLLGAIIACMARRAIHRVAAPVSTGERRVDPLPDVVAAAAKGFGGSATLERASTQPIIATPEIAKPAVGAGEPQDLKRIRLVDATLEAALNTHGVTRYEQIAGWMRADIDRVEQALGQKGRINQQNWIEQAQVLAKGGETQYSTRRARGETASAAPTADEGERRPIQPINTLPRPATGGAAAVAAEIAAPAPKPAPVAVRESTPAPMSGIPTTTPDVSNRAAFAETRAAAVMRPAPPAARDNLLRISGIDAPTEQRLAAQSVTRYSQIASWSPTDVERWDRQLATGGRIARENWIEQAQILNRGGDTAFSRELDRRTGEAAGQLRPARLSDAIREHSAVKTSEASRPASRPELGSLRSVRSEAYQNAEPGPEAARRAAAQNKVVRSANLEDLKRIRGIGVLIEKKLNSMGVVAYEQIADWTAQDIDRVSQTLDFKGRIERENWVEQARILASGGATEFSRRVDRGEIESSRVKT